MKIKSVVDVITNSSTEVFTIKNYDLPTILNLVSENLKYGGYTIPEIMEDQGNKVIESLHDFGYLYDTDDKEDMERFYLNFLLSETEAETINEKTGLYEIREIPGAKDLILAWKQHVWNNREMLNNYARSSNLWKNYNLIDEAFGVEYCTSKLYRPCDLPPNFIEDFLKNYPGTLPKETSYPNEDITVKFWIGKIGLMGTEDNSMNYEDIEKLLDIINEDDIYHWHLG